VSVFAVVVAAGGPGLLGRHGSVLFVAPLALQSLHLSSFSCLSVRSFVIDWGEMPPVRACFSLLRLRRVLMVAVDFGGGKLVVYAVMWECLLLEPIKNI
jgi:hypothetical protein